MKLAFCSISALDRPLADAARLAAEVGLTGLEVTARPPHLVPEDGLEAARAAGRAVREAGVEVVAYGSYLGRPEVPGALHAEREVALAAELGARRLRVWAEPMPETPGDPAPVADWLRRTCDAAAPHGVDVVVERHLGSFADTPERIDALFASVNRPNLALNYQVLDLLLPERAAEQPDDAARLVPRARYFHLKNYRPNPQAGGPLLPGASLEEGVLDYRAILAAALAAGYADPLTIEFLSFAPRPVEEKLRDDAAYLRRLLAELGSAA
jgi:sugar phosphate isomerase/epimerase